MKIGDKVAVQTKYFGQCRGVVTEVDKNGCAVVRHNAPGHPTGATYANPRDVIVLVGAVEPNLQAITYTKDGKVS